MTYDPTDPMNAYRGKPRNFGKVVRADAFKVTEWDEQLRFCKWLKHTYPDVLFRSDIQSAGKLSPQMQNIKQIIDPYSGWPDVVIYEETGSYNGLGIEMKRVGASLSGDHFKQQQAMHKRLELQQWKIVVCFGADEAKDAVRNYLGRMDIDLGTGSLF